ncbi:TonB-dependent receptor [Olivibacter sp. SDN3]|uniref:TonB-dependent receptor n=1 Tax=Olivibacter sp. SDN3 TaxID=2764720 RepID=UPI001C9E4362|nr:TonB-dependent receptor [Olivibacter sp. SDN3]
MYRKNTVLSYNTSHTSFKILLAMKLSVLLVFATLFQVSAAVVAQEVTVKVKNASLQQVFKSLKKQTGFDFLYLQEDLKDAKPVSLHVEKEPLVEVLESFLAERSLTYEIRNTSILVRKKSGENRQSTFIRPSVLPQQKEISGKVTDENGEPLGGVTVTVKGTAIALTTDPEGNYRIKAPESSDVLTFNYIGYQVQEVTFAGSTVIDVVLQTSVSDLDEVVVVGYGTQKRGSVTAAISSVPMRELQDMPVSNVATSMQGKIPGVVIQQTTGAPGSTPAIKVRGFGSITAGNAPLIVVDGNIVSADVFAQINSIDIESMDVLKDASSAAIYGSRGANGVIMVTTKKGKAGTSSVNLDVFAGVQNVSKTVDILNSQQFAALGVDASNNAYLDDVPGANINDPNDVRPSTFLRYRYPRGEVFDWFDFDDPIKVANLPYHDYQDLIFRAARMSSYQLSLAGGTDKTRYAVSGSYLDQDGVLRGADLKRYTLRANIETQVLPKLKMGVNLIPTYRTRNEVNDEGHWADNGVINAALSAIPMAPIYAADGLAYSSQTELAPAYNYPGVTNPVANITEQYDRRNTTNLVANAYAEYQVLENLTYRVTGNINFEGDRRNSYRSSRMPLNQLLPPTVATGTAASDQEISWLFNQTLNYNITFNENHNLGVLLGMESNRLAFESSSATGNAFPNDLVKTLNASADGATTTATSFMEEISTVSYFTRINYDYKGKYMVNFSVRRDGSSIFGPDRRWGSFPAVSAGWRISDEHFMRDIKGLSELKLRASYGLSGNNAFNNYYPHAALLSTENYAFNGVLANGLYASSPENRQLSWEKSEQLDLGLDLGLFNNRLYVTADYYDRTTKDLLLLVNVPTITGFNSVVQNIGEMQNRGWEFSVSSQNFTGPFVWNTNANLSFNRNKVLALGPTGDPIRSASGVGETNITMIGHPIGSFFGYRQIGIFMNQADLDAHPHDATSRPGDVKYADVNGDGIFNADDREIIGNNQPNFIYGLNNSFSFKGFDLNVAIQGSQGGQVLNLSRRFFENLEGGQNQLTTALNRWRSEADPGDGVTPRANARTTGLNNAVSSRWVEDGSYLRIQNVTLGYRLPASLIDRWNLKQVRIYLSAQNLHTFTKYKGYNPEVSNYESPLTGGVDYGSFPLARTISAGINIGL